MPIINIKNIKGIDFSCASPASTAICSSTDQNFMVKNTTKSLNRLNSYLNDHYKNTLNQHQSSSPRAPCISELPFTPRLSSSFREKTRKKSPSPSIVKHSDLTPRRKSTADIADVRRRYYDKCSNNSSILSPPHSHSSRYLLGESKLLDSLSESHQNVTNYRKSSSDALPLVPSTPLLVSREAHETKSFGSFLDVQKGNKSLTIVNPSDQRLIKSSKYDYDGHNQRHKSMGYDTNARNDSLVLKKSSSSAARSRDQVFIFIFIFNLS